jgi:predicted RNase H-like nuclease
LPRAGRRRADELARQQVGARRNSVFFTPVREALVAPTHREANAASLQLTGQGISQQAYALRTKILEAELFVASYSVPLWEVHPEVSFTVLLGQPPSASKKTWAGMRERVRALEAAGVRLDDLGVAGVVAAVDDVVDAAVAAWSCRRLVNGDAVSFPDPPVEDPETGRLVAIWA